MKKRALLSVADKRGLLEFARGLLDLGFELIATGGTKAALDEKGIASTPVETITGYPECFGGRVKTMHPAIMGGILFRRENPEDQKEAKKLGIEPIDLVAINLYPFEQTIAKPDTKRSEAIEQIDIGGPTLLRSAAKNHALVTVICDPADYDRVLDALKMGDLSPAMRSELAAKVFLRTAAYDSAIAAYLSEGEHSGVMLTDGKKLRYGENPHQRGLYFAKYEPLPTAANSIQWAVLQGKELSYLNILDADGAWNLVHEFGEPTAACIKHANPSGVASHADITEAFQRAYDADRLSAFGVIIALNRPCTKEIAQKIIDQKIFTEVVIAPSYDDGSVEILKQKPNIRVLELSGNTRQGLQYRSALGGMLVQDFDTKAVRREDLKCVTKKKPTDAQIDDMLFAWKVVKNASSNAIVFVKDKATVGIGCGQTSRVDALWIAARRAGDRAKGAVMASDAFFPFPDSVEEAAKHGISAIIQPGGSIRDEEVFKKADELGLTMVLTGVRGFRH
ncbi:MAG TPA: bifunctional phosphoribosylaminoimidazolecarboxamide formyltransferase/IMP cyclohydrolase [Candidatus Peribacteraceae bacterium]|nr:MAG: bifunctional phosphoribosylaminoimidazolecarboxamide formyltransferase/IMP cyclohydrolase [Candidatus Peribacteria bacterium RIFCSPHIGHO2_01_FULL_51_9]HLD71490.1 bifunctional phosphoribosylaminoimidazolecarboxamide formyltransferase/IMP cyclohydrolase [Candidatus Peribacteraceae bacterium]